MSNCITLGTNLDRTKLEADGHYRQFLDVMARLSCQVELIDYDYQDEVCGIIGRRMSDKQQAVNPKQLWLPIITCSQLSKPYLLENYLVRVLALVKLNQIRVDNFDKSAMISFHTHYKLLLLAYSQPDYRKIGPFVANIDNWPLAEFFIQYREMLMILLANHASRKNHTNVLHHIQGYFKPHLTSQQKHDLAQEIDLFRRGILPLLQIIYQLTDYLKQFPNDYLSHQYYLTGYADILMACCGDEK